MQHSRRIFLGASRGQGSPLRPPWAVDEAAFLTTCTRCHDCVAACPTELLAVGGGSYPEAVFLGDGLPKQCTFCQDCVRHCASGALSLEANVSPWSVCAGLDDSCMAFQGVVCYSCRESCESGAIGFEFTTVGISLPRFDALRCTGCGQCIADCPAQAIQMRHANTNSLSFRGVA